MAPDPGKPGAGSRSRHADGTYYSAGPYSPTAFTTFAQRAISLL